jgi:hypothetical protein
MGQIPDHYRLCNIIGCGQPPAFILEGVCPDDGTWMLGTMCAAHAQLVRASGTLSVCERCDGMLPLEAMRPWSEDDEELLRLGAMA